MRTNAEGTGIAPVRRWLSPRVVRLAFAALALAYAVPIVSGADDRLTRVNQAARERLIREHQLWELQPDFRGKPEVWARMASRLLNDRQLLARVATKYRGQSEAIELDYQRDLSIARAEVVLGAFALWAAPLAAAYGLAWALRRKKPAPPVKAQPPSASDPRYLPPGAP
jgi:hypothetical protein